MSIAIRHAITAADVTYEQYATALDCIASGKSFEQAGIFGDFFSKLFNPMKKVFDLVKKEAGIGLDELVKAFKAKSLFKVMKAIKFNLAKLYKGFQECAKLINKGLIEVFHQLNKLGVMKALKKGTMKIDELLNQFPILKRVGGIALAALLVWVWLNMSFTGHADSDFDFSSIASAFTGDYTLADMLVSDEAMASFVLLIPGMMGYTFPWLVHSAANIALALAYNGFKLSKDKKSMDRIKSLIPPMKRIS